MTDATLTAVIVAAGTGSRLGAALPKGLAPLAGKPLFLHSLETLLSHGAVHEAVVVVPAAFIDRARQAVDTLHPAKAVRVVAGGAERWESVRNGVSVCSCEWVLVHDAARPFVSRAVVDAVLEKSETFDCVITVTPVVDTVRQFSGDLAGTIVDRSKLVRIGTPQLFRLAKLSQAFSIAAGLPAPPTDEAALMQKAGVPVAIAWGDPLNFKVTGPSDLALAEALLKNRR